VSNSYVHGHGQRESERLQDQAGAFAGVGSTCPVRGGGTDISAWARLRREAVLADG
jgi:hypothetical protein